MYLGYLQSVTVTHNDGLTLSHQSNTNEQKLNVLYYDIEFSFSIWFLNTDRFCCSYSAGGEDKEITKDTERGKSKKIKRNSGWDYCSTEAHPPVNKIMTLERSVGLHCPHRKLRIVPLSPSASILHLKILWISESVLHSFSL